MLGGLALKRRWQKRRKAEGKPIDKPNLVTGINVQVCWDKFANYWDVEMRLVPMEGERYHLSPEEAVKLCDENTIGVVVVMGSTFDGSYEDVKKMSELLDDLQERTGLDIPIHVDGASGGFVAPFLDPDLEWDFRVPRVQSINVSGHKYGLVYPGVGWALWRDAEALPEDLIFWVNYLGDNMPTFALNFSRPGSQVVAQYYNFLRLGFEGYKRVQGTRARWPCTPRRRSPKMGPFELLTKGDELPVFAFKLKDEVENFTVFDVSAALRERGWQVPAYTFPKNREDLAALRIVVRRGFTMDVADMLLDDLRKKVKVLEKLPAPLCTQGPRRVPPLMAAREGRRRRPSRVLVPEVGCVSLRAPAATGHAGLRRARRARSRHAGVMVMVMAVMVMVPVASIAVPLVGAVLLACFDDFEVGLDVVMAPIAGVELDGLRRGVEVGRLRLDDRGADSSEDQCEHGQDEDGADDHGASFEFACGSVPTLAAACGAAMEQW